MTQVAAPVRGGNLVLDQRIDGIGIRHPQQRFGQTHQRNPFIVRQPVFGQKNFHQAGLGGAADIPYQLRRRIGDRTPGLRYNPDGSLDIYMQHQSPGSDKESNWLPAPAGDFRPILRMYQPRPEVLDGTYVLPPIRRVE